MVVPSMDAAKGWPLLWWATFPMENADVASEIEKRIKESSVLVPS